jgi:endonuclease/exonuclease/phosphatase family metal-dependent hydrolase
MIDSILKRIVLLLFSVVAFAGCATAGKNISVNDATLKVVSFNVRLSAANDGTNSWRFRREFFFKTVEQLAPTLIGFQEVRPDQNEEIAARMKNYQFVGVGRDDGKNAGERSLIGFEKSRFKKLSDGNFWLSETPSIPGSKSWDAAITRICTWVILLDRVTNREFLYANCHFDHKGVAARRNAARLLAAKLPDLAKGKPIILTGDFNFNEDSPGYAAIARADGNKRPWLIDSYREVHPKRLADEASFNGFTGVRNGSRIDFIFHSHEWKPLSSTIERVSENGRYPSDHYPVAAVLEFTK